MVGRQPTDVGAGTAQARDRAGRVVRASAWYGADVVVAVDDQIDEAFARDDDHADVADAGAASTVIAPVMMATASVMVWLLGVMTATRFPRR